MILLTHDDEAKWANVCNLIVSSAFCVLNSLLLGFSIHNQIKDAYFMNITCSTQTTHHNTRPYFCFNSNFSPYLTYCLNGSSYSMVIRTTIYFIYSLPLLLVITHHHPSTTHLLMPFRSFLYIMSHNNIVCNSKVKH